MTQTNAKIFTPEFRYRHIVWDWNGTLLDDAKMCYEIMLDLANERNLPQFTFEEYQDLITHPAQDCYMSLGFDFLNESYEDVAELFHTHYEERRPQLSLQTSVAGVLTTLSEDGVTHSIVSAHPHSILIESVKLYNLDECFIHIRGIADKLARGKIENGLAWAKEMDFAPSEVVFIGDTDHDAEVATAMGLDCILIAKGFQSKKKLEKACPNVLGSLEELLDYLRT